jgi:hypothetical protein
VGTVPNIKNDSIIILERRKTWILQILFVMKTKYHVGLATVMASLTVKPVTDAMVKVKSLSMAKRMKTKMSSEDS